MSEINIEDTKILIDFQINNLQNNLMAIGVPKFGDLWSSEKSDIEKTLNW